MKLIRFLVFSNTWISIGASAVTLMTFQFLNLEPNATLVLFVFFSTLFSYNFQRLSRISKLKNDSPNLWVVSHEKQAKVILIISLVGALLFNPFFTHPNTLFPVLILGFVSFGYSYRGLRDYPMVKIFLIASSWGILCGITPFFYTPFWNSVSWVQSFCWIFFYILAITIPFDIRDLHIDELEKNTLPQLFGIRKSKGLAFIFLLVSILCLFTFSSNSQFLFFVMSYIVAGILILKSSPDNKDLYFGLLIDGHIIFQFLMVYFLG